MKELTTQTGIIVKCSKTAIEFFQNAQSVDFFSALEIPKEFQDIAVEFYDLILENDHPTALLGCRGNRYLYRSSDLSALHPSGRPSRIPKLDRLAGAGY